MSDYISREAAIKKMKEERAYVGAFSFEEERAWSLGFHQAISFAISDLASLPAADVRSVEWISVTERLPCLTTPVLVTDGIEVDIAWMYGVPPRWITSYTAIDEDKLTHWMPLPQTPKEK